jgi:hypothetical protein
LKLPWPKDCPGTKRTQTDVTSIHPAIPAATTPTLEVLMLLLLR